MVKVCLVCGGKGCVEALVYCHKCRIYPVHLYCMEKVTLEEDVIWYCSDCQPVDELVKSDKSALDTADGRFCDVGPYVVLKDVAPKVQSLIELHPEIDQHCPSSVRVQSRLLQNLAIELKEVRSCTCENLIRQHLNSLDMAIKDAECAQLKISYLRSWHDLFSRMMDIGQFYKKIRIDLTKRDEASVADTIKDIQLLKKEASLLKLEMEDQEGSMKDFAASIKILSDMEQFCEKKLAQVSI